MASSARLSFFVFCVSFPVPVKYLFLYKDGTE